AIDSRRDHAEEEFSILRPIAHLHRSPALILIQHFASKTFLTQSIVRRTSSSEVRQLHTLTRIARMSRHVVPVKNASPEAFIDSITSSVRSPNRTSPWLMIGSAMTWAPGNLPIP